jgi:D-alanyl-lipoteichoic acid acyltransferase DltB (MBOAT superfamily)
MAVSAKRRKRAIRIIPRLPSSRIVFVVDVQFSSYFSALSAGPIITFKNFLSPINPTLIFKLFSVCHFIPSNKRRPAEWIRA